MADVAVQKHTDSSNNRLASNRHCIFRCGNSWFSLPAVAVREVVAVTSPVKVPGSPAWLLGLANLNNEFIPVLSLLKFLKNSTDDAERSESRLGGRLLVIGGAPSWAIRVDEISSISEIDATLAPANHTHGAKHSGIVGSFTLGDKVARVLESHHLLQQIQRSLSQYWAK